MQDFSIFFSLPQISSQPPYIRWLTDLKLQKYIQKLDRHHVDAIAYYLVTTAPSPNSNGCLTALLAHIAFIPALYRQRQVIPLDEAGIVSYLERLGTAISNYDRPKVSSIDLPLNEDGNLSVLDTIADDRNPLDTAILTEYQQQVDRLKNIVVDLLQQLPIDRDRLLMLFYGLNLTQIQVGIELNCHQTTVMRRREKVLAILAQNIYLQISKKSPPPPLASEHLDRIVTQAIAFCQQYYPDLLTELSWQLDRQDLQILIERVGSRWQIQLQPDGMAIAQLTKISNETP